MPCVGKDIPRFDGADKATGRALYIDDISMPGMWHGAIVRSEVPHGRVKKIELLPSFDWSGVITAGAADIPGKNCVSMIEEDLPLIADDVVKHIGEALLLIAAPTREKALEAKKHVRVEIEEWEPILTIEESKAAKIKIHGEDNVISRYAIDKGDLAQGFKEADLIVEGAYTVGHQEHMYIEPNGIIASPARHASLSAVDGGWVSLGDEGMVIIGSMQCPYYISKSMSVLMGMPEESFAIRQATVGGAFGGKEDYPSVLAGYCAILARKCDRPVKITYDRVEDTEVTTKRHPAIVRHRTGVKSDGTITAMEIDIEMDAGAYVTLTPVVVSRGILHSAGAYRCANVKASAVAYATNTIPNGAFRGFGAPQVIFPVEAHMERVAGKVGISPLEFRLKNCLRVKDTTATGQILRESVGGPACLEEAAKRSSFEKRRKEFDRKNEGAKLRRGIGLSFFMHGAGFTGSGEAKLKGEAALRLGSDGRIVVLTACTDMGQGAHTVLPQMAADHLGVDLSCIGIETPDTSLVPNSGPTVASRTTMIMGVVLGKCAAKLKDALFDFAAAKFEVKKDSLSFEGISLLSGKKKITTVAELVKSYIEGEGGGEILFKDHYELPPDIKWNEETYKGDAYPAFAWGCDVAEVEVDMETFEVRVVKMWLVQEIGKAINPKMAAGQIEGGTLQSVGYALMERHEIKRGRLVTNRFQNYIIPTTLDAPEMETVILEDPFSFGPMGAKGLGELPMNGGAPAIANAIAHATGLFPCDLPVTPERLYELWRNRES